jgi:penicillin-binding protein 1A
MAKTSKSGFSSEKMKQYFSDPSFRKRMSAKNRPRTRRERTIIAGLVGFAVLIAIVYTVYVISGIPSLEQLENPTPELATKVYSIDGEVLDQFYFKNRTYIPLEKVSKETIDALISTEDKDFYAHWGVAPWRFLRAMIKNVMTLRLREGASTITQQVSRNLYNLQGSRENTFDKMTRKLREFVTAVQIERTYTKKEILELYLNWIYLGRSAYGIAAASYTYFGKQPADLSLAESALLIGMAKGPYYYDPLRHTERAIERRNLVLSLMVKNGCITEAQAVAAKAAPLQLNSINQRTLTGIAPHFVEYIRQMLLQLAEKHGFNIFKDGLSVYTTLDSRMQRHANRAVEEHLAEQQPIFNKSWNWARHQDVLALALDKTIRETFVYRRAASPHERDSIMKALRVHRPFIDSVKEVWQGLQVGLIVLDPHSGGIRAMVGGSDFKSFKYGLNHTTQIERQPGSSFKPFVYTVAIDNGYAPSYELLNSPISLVMADKSYWKPENADGSIGGKYTLRQGLRESINLIAIHAILEIAPKERVAEYAKRMGITTHIPAYESIALGTASVIPLDMAAAFGVFANEGIYVHPNAILRIEDKDGNVLEEAVSERREVLSRETAYIMTSMMEDVVNHGTGMRVRSFFHYPAAGKTGTTQDFADAWFVGYTPALSAAVWIGFDDQRVKFTNWDGQGGRAAAPLWGRFMQYVYEDNSIKLPAQAFIRPEGVVVDTICTDTKKLATPYCPEKSTEIFNVKHQPPPCDKHTSDWKEGEQPAGKTRF